MAKIFVRERTLVGEGAGQPRFVIVGVLDTDLRIYAQHVRKEELEKLAEEAGAEIVFLPRGKNAEEGSQERPHGMGRRHRRRGAPDQD